MITFSGNSALRQSNGYLYQKTIGNRKGDCARSCSRWQTQPEKIYQLQHTNQCPLCTLYWFVRCNLQVFSGCVCHLEQLSAQSPFLFPIVFGLNLIPFSDIGSALAVFVGVCAPYLATAWSQLLLLWLWQLGFRVSQRAAMSNLSLSPYPLSNRGLQVCSTMVERTILSSFYNSMLSANEHVQNCRFSLSAAADLTDCSREHQTWPFNGDPHSWNGIERSLSRAVIPVSVRLRYHCSNSVVFVHCGGAYANEYPLSKLFSKAELLPFERESTSIWPVLLAWSMQTKCYWVIHGRLTSERKASTFPSSFINLAIPPLKRQGPCLYMLAWISLLLVHFAFLHQRAHSSTWVWSHPVTE